MRNKKKNKRNNSPRKQLITEVAHLEWEVCLIYITIML